MILNKKDILIITLITILYFSAASWNLGLTKTPTSYWSTNGKEEVSIIFDSNENVGKIYFLISSVQKIKSDISINSTDNFLKQTSLDMEDYYKWFQAELNKKTNVIKINILSGYGDIYEVVVVDDSNKIIKIKEIEVTNGDRTNIENLKDEQQYFENPPTFKSETYFDEIYFVKTAQEYLHLKEPTEWTHPPLGKLIIALGIWIFSFNPFGWRILGVVFSTLMIPVLYYLGLIIFKNRLAAFLSAILLFSDFMHFTMGRIATIDTYLVFFNLLSIIFFYMNFSQKSTKSDFNYKYIFFGVLFFYLAFSVKWTAIFNLIAQIILMVLIDSEVSINYFKDILPKVICSLKNISKVMLIIFLESVFYLSSFIPYMLIGHDLKDVFLTNWSMFSYHVELSATHPYSSPWYSWPLMLKPVWLYFRELPGGMVSTISAMGNPLIWWIGLPLILAAIWRGLKKGEKPFLFIGILYVFQLIPFTFISRPLFLYHYYINVPIMILGIAGFLSESWLNMKNRKLIILYLISTIIVFYLFYPLISGSSISIEYERILKFF